LQLNGETVKFSCRSFGYSVQQGVEILARHRVIAAFGLRKSSVSVTEIKTVGELISALKHIATDGALQMTYEMEAYEWSYT
jgi:hypothetical protein